MTLDEAIKCADEAADRRQKDAEDFRKAGLNADVEYCLGCSKGHRQLSAWLRELKVYRQILPSVHDYLEESGRNHGHEV